MSKELYWTKRVNQEVAKDRERLLKDTEKALTQICETEAELMRIRILDVFEKMREDEVHNPQGIMVNDLYRNRDYWALLDYLESRLSKLGKKQNQIVTKELIEAYENSQKLAEDFAPQDIKDKAKTQVSFLNVKALRPEDVISQVWCVDGKEFSSRIWEDKKNLLAAFKKAMMDYSIQGKSPWEISQQLKALTGNSDYNCFRLARTETCHFQIKGQVDKYQQYGFTHGKFLGSKTCCEHCHSNDGKVYTLEQIQKIIPVHPNCSCSFLLVV